MLLILTMMTKSQKKSCVSILQSMTCLLRPIFPQNCSMRQFKVVAMSMRNKELHLSVMKKLQLVSEADTSGIHEPKSGRSYIVHYATIGLFCF